MSMTIDIKKPIVDSTNNWVGVTIDILDGDTNVKYSDVLPRSLTDAEILAKEELFKLNILTNMYPGAIVSHVDGNTSLQDFEAWIAAGHINDTVDTDGNPVQVVVNKVSNAEDHSGLYIRSIDGGKIKQVTISELDAATTVDELRIVLKKILLGNPNIVNPNI